MYTSFLDQELISYR